ncbi:MAG: ABC transporter ATP-binding protein [Deinococcales bacterium]
MRLELRGITKRFGELVANDRIDLTAEGGEIHALLGENGAGKTTLMNVLNGLYRPDEGTIVLEGEDVHFDDPGDAIQAGIGMVHQNFMLIPVFTVAENVMLGFERTRRFGFLDRRRARADIRELSARFRLEVDPDAVVGELSVGQQQRVEIVKALAREAQVLILDEPTAVLTPQEIQDLFRVMRSLRESGKTILFITHKLKEVLEVADRITVIRMGKVVGTALPSESDESRLASMMVGRGVELQVTKSPPAPGEPVLEVEDLVALDDAGQVAVDGVSLTVHAGEIVSVAGVQGNGQTELAEALTGLATVVAGTVRIAGRDVTGAPPKEVLRSGVGHVPEDRQRDGLVGSFSIAENLILDVFDEPPYSRRGALDWNRIHATAEERMKEFDIRASSINTTAATLSGGNQQKVIVARELSRDIRLIIVSQPTRGLDVASIEDVHRRIVAARDGGAAVLVISAELDEAMQLADRIVVMYRGKLVGPYDQNEVSRDQIGLLMAGGSPAEVVAGGAS